MQWGKIGLRLPDRGVRKRLHRHIHIDSGTNLGAPRASIMATVGLSIRKRKCSYRYDY